MESNKPETKPSNTPVIPFETRMIFEAVAMRDINANTEIPPEIYLCQLPMSDTDFPGLWTVPRSRFRHGERAGHVALRLEKEFDTEIKDLREIKLCLRPLENETLFSHIFIVLLAEDPLVDNRRRWFPVNNLPSTVSDFHRTKIIPAALTAYMNYAIK